MNSLIHRFVWLVCALSLAGSGSAQQPPIPPIAPPAVAATEATPLETRRRLVVARAVVEQPTCRNDTTCGSCECDCDACCATMAEVTEKRSCWNVSCEKVCVPAIRYPWEPGGSGLTLFNCFLTRGKGKPCGACGKYGTAVDCCDTCAGGKQCCACSPPRCGAVRWVHVLEPESYEVTACRCKWEIERVPVRCTPGSCPHSCPACGDCAKAL